MKVLLIWPILPNSFWSYQETLDLLGLKTNMPPLGLITVAAMLPQEWEMRLIDRNVKLETEADWEWCDLVIVSAMIVQRDDLRHVIQTAKAKGKKVAVGGPFPTSVPDFALESGADYLILDEGEITIPMFLEALERGETSGTFRTLEKPDVTQTPIPRYDLLDLTAYMSMTIQFSRGCPFQCEFCDIITIYGRKPRTKTPQQMLAEFQALYELGWAGIIFVVDDNFIGNKRNAKVFLRELIPWMQERNFPFPLLTEASLNLAEDDELLELMVQAGFRAVFMGIETPDADSLMVANKEQNTRGSLVEACHKITRAGLKIISGFIIGFDGERSGAGQRIVDFVEESTIPEAHLGVLTALPNTAMWQRLKREGRLIDDTIEEQDGDTLSPQLALMNFVPTRPIEEIATEYIDAFWKLYEPTTYLKRTFRHLSMMQGKLQTNTNPDHVPPIAYQVGQAMAQKVGIRMLKAISWRYGVLRSTRFLYWKYLITLIIQKPHLVPGFLTILAFGEHLFKFRYEVREKIEKQIADRRAAIAAIGSVTPPDDQSLSSTAKSQSEAAA
ncbi:B12-binding domain-containing radical SAM protein [Leptolyngbya sp. NK1-12]|uniref:B12-binding domain-containing radical SAM protein n=1 Tax=Leptolyngbya sp. NK1-12 TaxID=2547451 RepID=A0AA97AEY3_9CYAN|nr:B12-binding domain-containing radical SAM protein [Leptolyngbya sp. NK1-12]WNZ21704.1 B12-binding domain-containing radical SAM protein [Leptolyngbya sp. NK1-12]